VQRDTAPKSRALLHSLVADVHLVDEGVLVSGGGAQDNFLSRLPTTFVRQMMSAWAEVPARTNKLALLIHANWEIERRM
jgi:hypothetical protein